MSWTPNGCGCDKFGGEEGVGSDWAEAVLTTHGKQMRENKPTAVN